MHTHSDRCFSRQALLGDVCKTFKNGATKARQLYQNALAIDATCNDAVDGELAQACLPACFFASRIGSVLGAAARIYRSIF